MEQDGKEVRKRERGSRKEGEEDRQKVRKKGRSTNVERLVRERALSISSMEGIDEMLGRKGKGGKRRGKRERFFKGAVRRREYRRGEKEGRGGERERGERGGRDGEKS